MSLAPAILKSSALHELELALKGNLKQPPATGLKNV
jgi:hypothetical protein